MIKPLQETKYINIYMRAELIKQSGIDQKFVINGLSLNGADLSWIDDNNVVHPFLPSDTFIIFELNETNDLDVIEPSDDKVAAYSSYSFKCTVYGTNASNICKTLQSRFLTDEVLASLHSKGIHIQEIQSIQSRNEVINNVVWIRKDLEFILNCEFEIDKLDKHFEFDEINSLSTLSISSH